MKPLYEQPKNESDRWYNKIGWLLLWVFLFFPVGIVGLLSNKTLSSSSKWILGVFGFAFMIGVLNNGNKKNGVSSQEYKTPTQRKEDSLNAVYESHRKILKDLRYEGRHRIKSGLKDPDSFEEIDHSESILDTPKPPVYYQSIIKYRAKNSFNGFVVETMCFDFNSIGGIVAAYECD